MIAKQLNEDLVTDIRDYWNKVDLRTIKVIFESLPRLYKRTHRAVHHVQSPEQEFHHEMLPIGGIPIGGIPNGGIPNGGISSVFNLLKT